MPWTRLILDYRAFYEVASENLFIAFITIRIIDITMTTIFNS